MASYSRILLDGAVTHVVADGDDLVARDGRRVVERDAVYLPPTEPSKILCVHLNHISRVREFQIQLTATPTYFQKPTSSLNSHRGQVVRPEGCQWLNYEGEVVIVIGAPCRNVSPDEAGDYIHGYTIGNDFGLHDFRDTDAGSMLRVKGSDTLCPVSSRTGVFSTDLRIRSATAMAPVAEVSRASTANSSPPKRAIMSSLRTERCRCPASARRAVSPAAWPQVSLTRLK